MDVPLRSITEAFGHDDPDCPNCRGDGHACEEHPEYPMGHPVEVSALGVTWIEECGWPGIPCPRFVSGLGS